MPKDAPCRVADSNDLCIEVRPAGAKAWRYRHAGKPGIVTIGEYPTMSLMPARAERDKLRVLQKGGERIRLMSPGPNELFKQSGRIARSERFRI